MRRIEIDGARLPDRPLNPGDPVHPGDPPGVPPPALQTWSRLEPLPLTPDMRPALQAGVADPLWLLARQWQFLEFAGEDAGTPIEVRVKGEAAMLSRFLAGAPDSTSTAPADDYRSDALPLEVAVEAEPARAAHPRLVAEAGLHLQRMLDAAGVPTLGAAFVAAYRLELAKAIPGDTSGDWLEIARGRAIDARTLRDALEPLKAPDGSLAAVPPELTVPEAARSTVLDVIARWLRWYEDALVEPPEDGEGAWSRHRLEYAFATSAQTSTSELVLAADQYTGGTLDWYSLSPSSAALDPPAKPRPPQSVTVQPTLPVPVNYAGKPADRFWEFEDAAVYFGAIDAGPTDLTRLLLVEFALAYGNDWFVVPARLPVGSLFQMTNFTVLDTFGVDTEVPRSQDRDPGWALFEIGTNARDEDAFFLAPALADALSSEPVEQVALFRDEMANMAWGVERRVQGASGDGYDRAGEGSPSAGAQQLDGAPVDAPLVYRLATTVPDHWIPFVPVAAEASTPGNPMVELQRRAIQRLDEIGQRRRAEPRGALLGGGDLRLAEEEIPREGAIVERAFQHTRWFDGRSLLWLGRRKSSGRGEGASGLRFDVLDPG